MSFEASQMAPEPHTSAYHRSLWLPDVPLHQARDLVEVALRAEGFGILWDLDLQDVLLRKADKDIGAYRLLSVCHPQLAARILDIDRALGLLLPCKIALWPERGGTTMAVLRADTTAEMAATPALLPIAREAEHRLEAVLAKVQDHHH